jgi:hypothetical protein
LGDAGLGWVRLQNGNRSVLRCADDVLCKLVPAFFGSLASIAIVSRATWSQVQVKVGDGDVRRRGSRDTESAA